MKPSEKSPEMEKTLDNIAEINFGRKRTDSIYDNICVACGGEAITFRDTLSRKEYTISGMCQDCQDEIFKD